VKHKIGLAMRELHRSENDLAGTLLQMSDRHKADHEVFHLARDLARWSQDHVRLLAEAGRGYGLDLSDDTAEDSGLMADVRQRAGELVGRRPEPGMLLLRDLRELYRKASGVSLDWEVLAQAAHATKDRELLALAQRCQPDTLRQARWANTKLKEAAPQVLAG
jgi:hypothetical protein